MHASTHWGRVAAAVVVMFWLAACGGSDGVATAEVLAEAADTASDSVADATDDELPPDATDGPVGPASFDPDAPPITDQFSLVEVGTHRVDTLGTPFSFTAHENMFVQFNRNGFIALTHPDSRRPDDRDIVLMRSSALSIPTDPTLYWDHPGEGWPADDFDGWLADLVPGVVVSDPESTTVGGLPATRIDLELGDFTCGVIFDCGLFATNQALEYKPLNPGSRYRISMVDQGDEDPIAIIVGINGESQGDWFDTADQVLSTVAFGEIAPNPVPVTPAGTAEVGLLGGVRIELANNLVFLNDGRGFDATYMGVAPAGTEYLPALFTTDGTRIETTDELVEVLEAASVELTELDPTQVGGQPTRVFDMSGGSPGSILLAAPDAPDGWFFQDAVGRMWAIEHADRGLMLATAWAAGFDKEGLLEWTLTRAEPILDSLLFIELG